MSDRWSGRGGYTQGQGLRFESHWPQSMRFYAKKARLPTSAETGRAGDYPMDLPYNYFFIFLPACRKVYFQRPTVKARVACRSVGARNLGLAHVYIETLIFFLPNSKTSLRNLPAAKKNNSRFSRSRELAPSPRRRRPPLDPPFLPRKNDGAS